MTQPEPTPEMLAMARRIAADAYKGNDQWQDSLRTDILAGNCDDGPVVQAALAALIEASELAAKMAEKTRGFTNLPELLRSWEHFNVQD